MQSEGNPKRKIAWHGTCLVCKAACDFLYTICVGLLAGTVCLFAYVVTLDETDMPEFLIRVLENEIKAQGATLSMSGIRIQPSGRITIDHPVIYSTELQSEIARADLISIKVDPALLLFGKTRLSELDVLNGSLIVPAILSPSGTPAPIVDQIDLRAENNRKGWTIKRSKLRFADALATASGTIDLADFPFLKPPKERKSLREQLIIFHKKAWEIKAVLTDVEGLEARFEINAPKGGGKTLRARLTAENVKWKDQASASDIQIDVSSILEESLVVESSIARILGPEKAFAENVALQAVWDAFPSPSEWKPASVSLAIESGGQEIEYASTFTINAKSLGGDDWAATCETNLGGALWHFDFVGNPSERTASVELAGSLSPGMVDIASAVAKMPLERFATIIDKPSIRASAQFDGAWMPVSVDASATVGRIASQDAAFDHVIAQAEIRGKYLNVPNLWLRTGAQHGWLSVDLDLDTMRRRLLINSLFNPNTINGWIPDPWWTEFWDNFQFPDEGFYCLMDSRQIIKHPETLYLTGQAFGENLGIRGHLMNQIETHMYIRQHYFDLYHMDVTREEGYIRGDAQFAIAEDPRDSKYKMSALWVDMETTADLHIGPDLIHEVRTDVEEILEPYRYEIPPYVKAKSTNIRHKDLYDYTIDLEVKTDNPFSYYHYPLDAVQAEVHLKNGYVIIPSLEASLASGKVSGKAEIIEDEIELSGSLSAAHFGDTLKASSIYFLANDPEGSASSFPPEELSSYGGLMDMSFEGKGIVGDSLSYDGKGTYAISGADFYQLQIFGGLSKALEGTGLSFTTLKFEDAAGDFEVNKRYVEFPDVRLKGPVAQIRGGGNYDMEVGELDFKLKLLPFRSMPLINIPGLVFDTVLGIFEINLSGSVSEPKWSLFRGQQAREEAAPPATETSSE